MQVCDTNIEGTKGRYFDAIKKEFDCEILLENDIFDWTEDGLKRPRSIDKLSDNLKKLFSHDGKVNMSSILYRDDSKGRTHSLVWPKESIERIITGIKEGTGFYGAYGDENSVNIQKHIKEYLSPNHLGKVLVIGSQTPWIEAMLLHEGAEKVYTLEYEKIDCDDDRIKIFTPDELRQKLKNGDDEVLDFDAVVSFSSLEHSGLGRYGDGLNPWGDFIGMARAWCLTREGGRALIGVPSGFDYVDFNSHRLYGKFMLSHLFANWNQIHTDAVFLPLGFDTPMEDRPVKLDEFYAYQPIYIVEKPTADQKSREEL